MSKSKGGKAEELGMKYGRPDLVRMGLFSEAQYVSSGESYNPKKAGKNYIFRLILRCVCFRTWRFDYTCFDVDDLWLTGLC